MKYFVRVVELQSITRAAASLGVAQPALGLQIRNLEAELGTNLLVRHARGVAPTKAGQTLYQRAIRILGDVAEAAREVRASQGKETIRLGLTPSLMQVIGADLKSMAERALSGIDLQTVEDISLSLIEKLKRRDVDLALVYSVEDSREVTRHRLYDEEICLITAARLGHRGGKVSLARALEFDLVIQTERSAVYQIVREAAKAAAIEPKVVYSATSSRRVLELAARGLAAAVLPSSVVRRATGCGPVTVRPIEKPKVARTLYLVRRRGGEPTRNDEKLDAFLRRLFKTKGHRWFGAAAGPTRRKAR